MQLFQPSLLLSIEPGGQYLLDAVTITPNSSYSAGRASLGVPPNVRISSETYSVLLNLHARRGKALQVPTPVHHHLRNLDLGPGHGKTSVLAFAMLQGHVIGSASITIGPVRECPQPSPVIVDTRDWYAWLDKSPPGPPSFHVTGLVYAPTPGYDARLVPAVPQGINPVELILDLQVTPRTGLWPQVVTPLAVCYEQCPARVEYKGVLVREPDGDAMHFEVEHVR
ncbi:MAG TPA: hypothetical protein VN253_18745 [Kofleriaceae bacterium]|nr:hypothetical protein [Kofleriaceae bacterium]